MESPEEVAEEDEVDYEPDELNMVQHVLRASGVHYQIIKVPQLVADMWRGAPPNTTVAHASFRSDASGGFQIESLRVQCGGLTTLRRGSDVGSGGYWFDADFGRREAIQYRGQVGKLTCLVPLLDEKFRSLIRERHTTAATHGGRQTREDIQGDVNGWDSSSTIFQYYCGASPGRLGGSTSSSIDRQTRKIVIREDELQLKILNLFEGASSGLQLKQISEAVRQPMKAIKQVLDEIAVQKVRSLDRKVAYFLRKQFAVPGELSGPPSPDRADRPRRETPQAVTWPVGILEQRPLNAQIRPKGARHESHGVIEMAAVRAARGRCLLEVRRDPRSMCLSIYALTLGLCWCAVDTQWYKESSFERMLRRRGIIARGNLDERPPWQRRAAVAWALAKCTEPGRLALTLVLLRWWPA